MRFMGTLPSLATPSLERALVICFGTGQTANAVRKQQPERLDIADVNANVLRAAPLFAMNEGVLRDPRTHAVVMDGRAFLRRAIGVIAQDPFLFSASVRENIAFGRGDLQHEEVERAARAAQAHEFIENLPQGYDTVIGERGITLSGGQRQRIAIARALAINPRILILDDATASVDATTEARIRVGLREAMRDRTTLIIAHRLSTIALADEIVVLDDGRIAARGTHDDLLESSSVYREIYEHGLLERQFADAVEARRDVEEVA